MRIKLDAAREENVQLLARLKELREHGNKLILTNEGSIKELKDSHDEKVRKMKERAKRLQKEREEAERSVEKMVLARLEEGGDEESLRHKSTIERQTKMIEELRRESMDSDEMIERLQKKIQLSALTRSKEDEERFQQGNSSMRIKLDAAREENVQLLARLKELREHGNKLILTNEGSIKELKDSHDEKVRKMKERAKRLQKEREEAERSVEKMVLARLEEGGDEESLRHKSTIERQTKMIEELRRESMDSDEMIERLQKKIQLSALTRSKEDEERFQQGNSSTAASTKLCRVCTERSLTTSGGKKENKNNLEEKNEVLKRTMEKEIKNYRIKLVEMQQVIQEQQTIVTQTTKARKNRTERPTDILLPPSTPGGKRKEEKKDEREWYDTRDPQWSEQQRSSQQRSLLQQRPTEVSSPSGGIDLSLERKEQQWTPDNLDDYYDQEVVEANANVNVAMRRDHMDTSTPRHLMRGFTAVTERRSGGSRSGRRSSSTSPSFLTNHATTSTITGENERRSILSTGRATSSTTALTSTASNYMQRRKWSQNEAAKVKGGEEEEEAEEMASAASSGDSATDKLVPTESTFATYQHATRSIKRATDDVRQRRSRSSSPASTKVSPGYFKQVWHQVDRDVGRVSSLESPGYFTPKNIRATSRRLESSDSSSGKSRWRHGDEDDMDMALNGELDGESEERERTLTKFSKSRTKKKKREEVIDTKYPEPLDEKLSRAPSSATTSGNHFWFGCGKIKKKMEYYRTQTMKMRSELSSKNLKSVPHPDKYITRNGPPKNLKHVNDEQAYWHGCAVCRWELSMHTTFHDDAKKILQDDEDDHMIRESRERATRKSKLYVL